MPTRSSARPRVCGATTVPASWRFGAPITKRTACPTVQKDGECRMTTKRTPRKRIAHRRITPEAVRAYRARDYMALHEALGLMPWSPRHCRSKMTPSESIRDRHRNRTGHVLIALPIGNWRSAFSTSLKRRSERSERKGLAGRNEGIGVHERALGVNLKRGVGAGAAPMDGPPCLSATFLIAANPNITSGCQSPA